MSNEKLRCESCPDAKKCVWVKSISPRYELKEYEHGYKVVDTVENEVVCTGRVHGIMMGICDIMNSTEGGSNVVF